MEKKRLKIDMGDLCFAIDDNSWEHSQFLDMETGELLFFSDYVDEEDMEISKSEVEESERYKPIPIAESSDGYRDMVEFIDSLDNEKLIEVLSVAINGPGAFRRFRDVLYNYPEEQEQWYKFQNDRIRERAMEWLEEIGVEPVEE